jgi:hypothetical protein
MEATRRQYLGRMRAALATAVITAAALITPAAAPAAAPGPAKVARAIRSAERSRSLWATINICSSHAYRNDLGVRGQMPTLGFSASLSMQIQVQYWSTAKGRFVPIQSSAATSSLSLGSATSGLQQDGAVFPFKAHTGLLTATVTFTWTRGGRVIGRTARRTTAGHRDADFGSPAHYSAAQCRIK